MKSGWRKQNKNKAASGSLDKSGKVFLQSLFNYPIKLLLQLF